MTSLLRSMLAKEGFSPEKRHAARCGTHHHHAGLAPVPPAVKEGCLSKEEVAAMTPGQVHGVLADAGLLVDGFPFVLDLERSEGVWLVDAVTGKRYLDCFSFFASWALGQNHPRMSDAEFAAQMGAVARHNPPNADVYTLPLAQFVATFKRVLMPAEFRHVFFISGGALAVDNAIKCAVDWKVRKNLARGRGEVGKRVVYFSSAFHGRAGYSMSCTRSDPVKYMYFPRFGDWVCVPDPPACTFPLAEGDNLRSVERAEQAALARVEEALVAGRGEEVAAIIIEPIQAEGGDHHFRPAFLQGLRRLADEHEAMLIFDEVQTGVGMTGRTWAYEHFGVVPDLLAFGKKVQVSGFMATSRVDEVPDNVFRLSGRIDSTWAGNLADMARARRILEVIEEEGLVQRAALVGAHFLDRLRAVQRRHPSLVSNVRGRGLFLAFTMCDAKSRNEFKALALDAGLVVLSCGASSIRLRPPLIISPEEADQAVAIIEGVLDVLAASQKGRSSSQ